MSIVPSNIFYPFDLNLWDPFHEFRFNKTSAAAPANASVDWKETPEAHVFKADLPGVRKEEVKVEVEDGNVLNISGERSREKGEESGTWHRMERGIGKFMRRFRLPKDAKVDKAEAAMENGVLTVTVPKEEVKSIVRLISKNLQHV